MPRPALSQQAWGQTPAGETVTLYTLQNEHARVQVMDYGGVIVGVQTPDRAGTWGEITLGHDHLAPYLSHDTTAYFGALIGRYGNRIAGGTFTLGGQRYTLAQNNGPNSLHGGLVGFDQVLWHSAAHETPQGLEVKLTRQSFDGEEGFPGALDVTVIYRLTPAGSLELEYHATTDRPTVVNLTNHTYWNLGGGTRDVLEHLVQINADALTPINADLIPTGELMPVADTPFDFRAPRPIGAGLGQVQIQLQHIQLQNAGGYDHNWVLRGSGLKHAATVYDPTSGRTLDTHTTEPGVQFYSGNFLDGDITGRGGQPFHKHWGFCLETQHFPDSPNQPSFPSVRLNPGQEYRSLTRYSFGVREA